MATEPNRVVKLSGLRQILDVLDAQPRLPVPTVVTYEVHADDDLAGFEAVSRIAHLLGVTVASSPNGTQRASIKRGPVTLAYVYHPALVVVPR